MHYLFGFSGRINRAKQWAFLLVGFGWEILSFVAIGMTIGLQPILNILVHQAPLSTIAESPQARLAAGLLVALYLLFLYMALAVEAKRLHDRDKSAWWLLVFVALPLVLSLPSFAMLGEAFRNLGAVVKAVQQNLPPPQPPARSPLVVLTSGAAEIIELWGFVEFYILRGTVGDNRYGPDPLAERG